MADPHKSRPVGAGLRTRLDRFDLAVAQRMHRFGHPLHRVLLGALFLWFGSLKILGHTSATGVIAHTVYIGSPEITVPLLGLWEASIGVCLIAPSFVRVALLLIAVRLPGTLLALVVKSDVCWTSTPLVPTIEGQYLIKDFTLFAAAMVIGGTVRRDTHA